VEKRDVMSPGSCPAHGDEMEAGAEPSEPKGADGGRLGGTLRARPVGPRSSRVRQTCLNALAVERGLGLRTMRFSGIRGRV
jgi:hypothetical protein